MRKSISIWLWLAAVLVLGTAAFAGEEDLAVVRVGALSWPTAMGMVKLMDQMEAGDTQNTYEFADLLTEAFTFAAPLASGEIDIAAVSSNLASVFYNNTGASLRCWRSICWVC